MNQILYTGKVKSKGPASLKSIVRFFSICLIILGLIFIGEGSYALYQDRMLSKSEIDTSIPDIAFEQDGNNAVVNITHNKGISKIKYHWNDDEETILQGNSKNSAILDTISIPQGKNTLHVSVIDINNKSSESSFEYAYDGISIELAVVDNNYINIVASDVNGLSSIKYKWNSDEEITAYPAEEDPTKIEQKVEIPSGLNTLSITAVNLENKTVTKTQDIKGVHVPTIKTYIQSGYLIVTVTDEQGINKITHQINDEEPKEITCNGLKEAKYKYNIADKENILITITATNVDGATKTYKGRKN